MKRLISRYFDRIPDRNTPADPKAVISPADGIVWQIFPLGAEGGMSPNSELKVDKRIFGKIRTLASDVEEAGTLISIFMRPWDAHVNWSPVEGTVLSVRHSPGKFHVANSWRSLENEKNEILIQTEKEKIKLIQIAGFIARRIECWISENQKISKGEKIGMIHLASQASIILAKNIRLTVKKGQKVIGGETVLGWRE